MKRNNWVLLLLVWMMGLAPLKTIDAAEKSKAIDATERSQYADSQWFANLRMGWLTHEDQQGNSNDSSAVGGKLGFTTSVWNGLSFGVTGYSTQKLSDDGNSTLFGSDGDSYSILGEAYIQGQWGQNSVKAGRFELDSPFADTDDIRMVPNTFSGAVFTNKSLSDTTFYVAHLDEWAGVDSDKPEQFTALNNDKGISLLGAVHQANDLLELQAWYYRGRNLIDIVYLEAGYQKEQWELGAQYSSQSDSSLEDGELIDGNNKDSDSHIYGVYAGYGFEHFNVVTAYNRVSGTATNGFGGGPYFTSADDHTLADRAGQTARSIALEYTALDHWHVAIMHADFEKGTNETDFTVNYVFTKDMELEFIYTDMKADGSMARLMFNTRF